MVKKGIHVGRLGGMKLPNSAKQYIILQYVYGTSFMIEGRQERVGNMVDILDTLSLASRFKINWDKLTSYWRSIITDKPTCLDQYKWF